MSRQEKRRLARLKAKQLKREKRCAARSMAKQLTKHDGFELCPICKQPLEPLVWIGEGDPPLPCGKHHYLAIPEGWVYAKDFNGVKNE